MACRAGCVTQDHKTWGDCARAAKLQVPTQESQIHTPGVMPPRLWDAEIKAYHQARSEGIQPASTRMKDIQAALDISRATGKRLDATSGTLED